MKLRTFLTTSGIAIAIAAFVAMLSFGAGNQEYITEQYNQLGLFSTIQVYPKENTKNNDSIPAPKLDNAALERLAEVPGVNLVYPYDAFSVKAYIGDTIIDSKAQALSSKAMGTKLFSKVLTGKPFGSDSAREVIVSDVFLKKAGINAPESTIGMPIALTVHVSVIDSGLTHILVDGGVTILERIKKIHFDSLWDDSYRRKVIQTEANSTIRRFLNGFLNARETISDTLTICCVREGNNMGNVRIEPIIIPFETAKRFSSRGLGGNPAEIFAAMSSGTLFSQADDSNERTFSQVTLNIDQHVLYQTVKDSVENMGFRTFSFAAQFEEFQRVFFYFDLAIGAVGLIALITASLGIVNTMVMSITERKREIGILKSLGADERDIRILFLVESGVIGLLGTVAGIVCGFIITRIVSAIAQAYMHGEGIPTIDLFALPMWLILIAMGVGIGVSVTAGLYPAARAAHIDPVEALRND
jgi:ABC-type antimicrobial peptide transport system permease subunit